MTPQARPFMIECIRRDSAEEMPMNSSQQPFLALPHGAPESAHHVMDEDVPLGCECADPALQIDGWGEEGAQPLQHVTSGKW